MLLLLATKRLGRGDGGKFLSEIKGSSNGKNKRLTSCFTMDRIYFHYFVNVELSFHGVEGQMAVYTTQRTKKRGHFYCHVSDKIKVVIKSLKIKL